MGSRGWALGACIARRMGWAAGAGVIRRRWTGRGRGMRAARGRRGAGVGRRGRLVGEGKRRRRMGTPVELVYAPPHGSGYARTTPRTFSASPGAFHSDYGGGGGYFAADAPGYDGGMSDGAGFGYAPGGYGNGVYAGFGRTTVGGAAQPPGRTARRRSGSRTLGWRRAWACVRRCRLGSVGGSRRKTRMISLRTGTVGGGRMRLVRARRSRERMRTARAALMRGRLQGRLRLGLEKTMREGAGAGGVARARRRLRCLASQQRRRSPWQRLALLCARRTRA